jgi:hypothetical protein
MISQIFVILQVFALKRRFGEYPINVYLKHMKIKTCKECLAVSLGIERKVNCKRVGRLERIRSLYTSSTTNFIFHYIKSYMFRTYNQVIIRPTSKLSLQMLCLMGSHLVHIRKNIKLLIQLS